MVNRIGVPKDKSLHSIRSPRRKDKFMCKQEQRLLKQWVELAFDRTSLEKRRWHKYTKHVNTCKLCAKIRKEIGE